MIEYLFFLLMYIRYTLTYIQSSNITEIYFTFTLNGWNRKDKEVKLNILISSYQILEDY